MQHYKNTSAGVLSAPALQDSNLWTPERVCALTLLIGALVCFLWAIASRAGIPAMWLDELSVRYAYATKPLATLLRSPVSLSYLLCKWSDWIAPTDLSVRIPILAGALLVLLGTYATVTQWGNRYIAVAATWVVLWHPLFADYALQNRFYIPGTGLMLVAWAAAVAAFRAQTAWHWAGYAALAFLTAHMWPWGSPWIGLIAAGFGIAQTVRCWERRRVRGEVWRWLLALIMLGTPVALFLVHYLYGRGAVLSIGTTNDAWWHAPKAITATYLCEMVRLGLEPLWQQQGEALTVALLTSVFVVAFARRWEALLFAAFSVFTWALAVHMCNKAQVDPIPRRLMFLQIQAVILLFSGPAAVCGMAHERCMRVMAGRRGAVWGFSVIVAVGVACWMWWYGADRMLQTHGDAALDHRLPFKQYGAAIRLRSAPGTHVVAHEDGRGITWAMQAYALGGDAGTNITLEPYWTHVNGAHRFEASRARAYLTNAPPTWVIARPGVLPAETRDLISRASIRLPVEYEIWWCEPRFATMTSETKAQELKRLALDVNACLPPLDVPAYVMSNAIQRANAIDADALIRMVFAGRMRSREDCQAFARVLQQNDQDAWALKVMQAPLSYISRHPSMFEWVANNLLTLAGTAQEGKEALYRASALDCLCKAKRRGSPTAAQMAQVTATRLALDRAGSVVLTARPDFNDLPGRRVHAYFASPAVLGNCEGDLFPLLVPPSAALMWIGHGTNVNFTADGYHGTRDAYLRASLSDLYISTQSLSVLIVLRPPTNDVLQMLIGQGRGRSPSDSPWFLAFHPLQCVTFMMQFTDVARGNYELRVSYPWQKSWNHTWLFFAGTYDACARKVRLYLNGVLLGEQTVDAHSGRNILPVPLTVGSLMDCAYPFLGTIREIAVLDRPLTQRDLFKITKSLSAE
jgi:hypothetical protein